MATVQFLYAPALTYLGALPEKGARGKMYFDQNRNASYVPAVLLRMASSQLVERNGKKVRLYSKIYLKQSADVTIKHLPPVTLKLAKQLQCDYRRQFEMRLQLLLRQFMLTFAMGLKFSDARSSARAEGVVGMGIKGYQAAHSATLPRLPYRFNTHGGEAIFAGNTALGDGDATILLPDDANTVDTSIDLYGNKLGVKALRAVALELMDAVSSINRQTTPADGLSRFLLAASSVLRAQYKQCKENAIQSLVTANYFSVVQRYQNHMKTDATFLNRLCMCKGTLDAAGYIILRDQMHGLVSVEGAKVALIAADPQLEENGQLIVKGVIYKVEIVPTVQVKKHTIVCLKSDKVRNMVKLYHETVGATILQDLAVLQGGGGAVKLKKKVSTTMLSVVNECVTAIGMKRIPNLHTIVQWVLTSMGHN